MPLPFTPIHLNFRRVALLASGLLSLTLFGCGGGGNETPAETLSTPPVGLKRDYQMTDTDNSNNVIPWQLESNILSSAADGSFTVSFVGNGGNIAVNGTRYGTVNEVDTYNANHALVGYTIQGTTPVTCTYDTPVPPLPSNLPTGTAWPIVVSHVACNNGIAFNISRQDGSAIGVESITVPAGTFSANKVQYKRVISNSTNSSIKTEQHTIWYDTASGRLLQSNTDVTYANTTFSSGYLAHEVQQLLTTAQTCTTACGISASSAKFWNVL